MGHYWTKLKPNGLALLKRTLNFGFHCLAKMFGNLRVTHDLQLSCGFCLFYSESHIFLSTGRIFQNHSELIENLFIGHFSTIQFCSYIVGDKFLNNNFNKPPFVAPESPLLKCFFLREINSLNIKS